MWEPAHIADVMLRPSAAHRWMRCSASAAVEAEMPDSSSRYADEGTVAHLVAENALVRGDDCMAQLGGEYQVNGRVYGIDYEMVHAVQRYVDYVRGLPGELLVEVKLDLSPYLPNDGTSDSVVVDWEGAAIYVTDLKYGQGKRVIAKDNEQLLTYGLGVYDKIRPMLDVDDPADVTVHLTVHQPRLNHVDTFTVYGDALEAFGPRLREAALKARSDDVEFAAGAHCKFCRFQRRCRAYAEHALKTVADEFGDVSNFTLKDQAELTEEEVATLYGKAGIVRDWLNALEAAAYGIAETVGLPGWKLVDGRAGQRRWKDEDAVAKACKSRKGLKLDDYMPRSLLSPAQLEKVIADKAVFKATFADHITQTPGRPTLAPDNDPRPARNAADEFEDVSSVLD